MKKFLFVNGISWINMINPPDSDVDEIVKKYDFHEIIEEDLKEENVQDKIDVYDDCVFLVLHFPKYNERKMRYYNNEFNIVLWKDYLITLTKYETNHITKIKEEYKDDIKANKADKYKISPYYILYRILDVMHDKILLSLTRFTKDLTKLEEWIFDGKKLHKDLLEKLMIKKRNIVFLKNMIIPHKDVLEELHGATLKLYQWDLDVYFEDLQYKLDKIKANVRIVEENTEWLSNTYNTLANIQTNWMISILTIFTAITWVMTLITWFFGMNVALPWQNVAGMYIVVIVWMLALMVPLLLIFRKKGRI